MFQILDELQTLIPALTENEFKQLEKNCLEQGIRDALVVAVVDGNKYLADGHNRNAIAIKHDLPYQVKEMPFASLVAVKDWMILNQLGKRNLTKEQKSSLRGLQFRMMQNKHGGDRKSNRQNVGLITAEILAEQHKVSPRTIERDALYSDSIEKIGSQSPTLKNKILNREVKSTAKDVHQLAAMPEEKVLPIIAKIESGEVSSIKDAIKQEKIQAREKDIEQQVRAIESGALPELAGLYDVIAIDPPWPYGRTYDPSSSRVANPYPEMSIEEITAIELPEKEDAVLFFWTTHRFLPDALRIMETWGYQYKASLVWDKDKIGMGHWLRMQCEFCLVGIKGKPFWSNTTWRDIIREGRRQHSRKPEIFYELVESVTRGRKLDYFSREKRENWDNYGNETEKF